VAELQADEWQCRCDHRRRHLAGASPRVTAVQHHGDHRRRHGDRHQERPRDVVLAYRLVGCRAIESQEEAAPEGHADPHRDHHLDEVADEVQPGPGLGDADMCERCCHCW
jgi:hypothetical protein